MRILVVEDEPKLNKGIVKGLKTRGYAVDFAFEGQAGENLARKNPYDVILLDIMMPRRDGLTVCRNLRKDGITTPILFLTAKDAVEDKVTGLDEGADDYLVKPFSFEELTARIRSLLRRPNGMVADTLVLDDLKLDTQAQRLTISDKEISLTTREYALLEYLLRNYDKVITREDILDHVWDNFYDSLSNVVDVHLKNLRKKLPKDYAKRIKTIRGKGYRIA
ncbi:MAG: DNA-binding response regulator [Candidatus Andersenbacteria bacterium RIFCSPHIGHO2_12_FULL_45_11]|uniref:DNA-binding response regulator n=1 Tax=Candidatus Andersenbacteria bacterium RIFCSPHIGHO2_12_FULL_45_11 TaxID=1797281 RepID=A0A1G1X6L0_9BACT|nr:MAG: DNA-binding response regulator [Candidatus Andersenbacteria bacterium RIFCSPHIGHO2_12_FULL_45_11]